MEWFVLWLGLCLIPAVIASKRGRSGGGWFVLGIFISPLLATIIVFALDDLSKKHCPRCGEAIPMSAQVCPFCTRNVLQSTDESAEFNPDALTKKCPDCAESIKLEAIVCRFCGHKFDPADVHAAIEQARSEFEGKLVVDSGAEPPLYPHIGCPCPKCNSVKTISTQETDEHIAWNCRECGNRWKRPLPTLLEAWERKSHSS